MATVTDIRARQRESMRRLRAERGEGRNAAGEFKQLCQVCGAVYSTDNKSVRVCGLGECANDQIKGEPWTLKHFEAWAKRRVVLDNNKPWLFEDFHRWFFTDVFKGFREVWQLIGEGNTKTTSLAGLALYHIAFVDEGRVPVAAASRDQAFEMYLQAQGMVERSPELQPVFVCHEGLRQIKCASRRSRMQIYASDDRTGDGAIFTLALLDELHRHRDLRLYRTWAGKAEKRGGQVAGISTAGEPGSEFELAREAMRQGGVKVTRKPGYIRAESEDSVLHEFALPEGGSIEDMEQVKLANPFSRITPESLRRKRNLPTMTVSHWSRMTCNRATRGSNAAIMESEWAAQETPERIPQGEPVWVGLDVAWRLDTTAAVPFWPKSQEFRLFGVPTVLVPPRDGSSLDPNLVEKALHDINNVNPISTLVMDTSRAEQLAAWAEAEFGCVVVDRAQTNSLAALDYSRWMEALRNRHLWHPGDPTFTKHVLNAIARQLPSEKTRFDRPVQNRAKSDGEQERRVIDALTAGSMAHSVWVAEWEEEPQEEMPHFAWA